MTTGYPLELLEQREVVNNFVDPEYVQSMAEEMAELFKAYGVRATIVGTRMTPFAVMFDVVPDAGVSVKTFRNLRLDFELHMASPVEITQTGEQNYTVGISIKKLNRPVIGLKEVLTSKEFRNNDYVLPIAGGMDVLGKSFCFDLAATPNMLIAGTTGSGKSVFLNDMILSLLYTKSPEELKFIMIDPKFVELTCFNGLPHMMLPVIYDTQKALDAMNFLESLEEKRLKDFLNIGVKNFEDFNKAVEEKDRMSRIVVIIDEYMEMMFRAPKELEKQIVLVASRSRATGIHLVLATQRPSSDIITPAIKGRILCRASFTVVDWRESKTIIDRTGAERLLGSGDMLFSLSDSELPIHAQASYVSDKEIDCVVNYLKANAEEEKITK